MLKGKNIILGISGGIAAYKAATLVRILIKSGANVKVVATRNALEFITKVTLETLSKNKLYSDVFDNTNDYATEHISLTDWADLMIVAPATANIIGKFANGIADDALSTTFLAFNKQVYLAPSMNTKMYEHYSVRKNIEYLASKGVRMVEPANGFLACGYEGKGRMEEPENIVNFIVEDLKRSNKFAGKKVLVTAGPTVEAIDPVRYISNHSTGKMGYAIADVFVKQGALVTLVSGPTAINIPLGLDSFKNTVSAENMFNVVMNDVATYDIIVMSAAVADYTPKKVVDTKIKKEDSSFEIELIKTKDILGELGRIKNTNQILVGFALETDNEIPNAIAKLEKKNLDCIVLNTLKDSGAGFGFDTNKIAIVDKNKKVYNFELKDKKSVALDIVEFVSTLIN